MQFTYKTIKDGQIVKKKIEAENKQKLIEYLKSHNYLIIDIEEDRKPLQGLSDTLFSRVSYEDIVDLTRQFAIMFNAGLTIIDILDILKKQIKKPAIIALLNNIDEEIRAGNTLSGSLKKHPDLFNNLYISLVRAGEASGKLDEILLKLADNLEKQRTFRAKIKGALIYPMLVIIGMIGVMFVMITFVIPKLLDLYKDFNVDLPTSTKILIFISNFFQKTWIVLIIGGAGLFILMKRYLKTKSGKYIKDLIMLKLPIVSKIIKMSALVDTTRTLSILIGSGVSILDALSIAIETSSNVVFQGAFETIYKKIEKGDSLGHSLAQSELFPPILVQMTTVGEQTGHLDDTLLRMSNYFEMESELAIKTMTTLIEPLILVVLGFGVGFLVLSVITPIYNLTNSF